MSLVPSKRDKSNESEIFSFIIITEILKYCHDYSALKMIQSSTARMNLLFTCPSQIIWKQLCLKKKYSHLLRKESKCFFKRFALIWESIYYQNWKLNMNWMHNKCETLDLSNILHKNRDRSKFLTKTMNGNASLALLIPIDSINDYIELWDIKRGVLLVHRKVDGQITSSSIQGNILVLGKSCGSMTVMSLFNQSENDASNCKTVKNHSKEISALLIDIRNKIIISADIGGLIIKSSLEDLKPIIIGDFGSGITGMLQNQNLGTFAVTTIDGEFINLYNNDSSTKYKKINTDDFGSLNCIGRTNDWRFIIGSDSGNVILVQKEGYRVLETDCDSPITAIAVSDDFRIVIGHFNGTISAFKFKSKDNIWYKCFREENRTCGPIWSLGIDDVSLISCSLDGSVVLRKYL